MLDHLVYAAPELERAVDEIERRVGVKPAFGGTHAGGLTHNSLLSLGPGSYLEIIAPVPGSEAPSGALPFGLETLKQPRLVTWAVALDDVEGPVEAGAGGRLRSRRKDGGRPRPS